MTKKHFIAAAEQVRLSGLPPKSKLLVACQFADFFQQYNPQFQRERFMTACGV